MKIKNILISLVIFLGLLPVSTVLAVDQTFSVNSSYDDINETNGSFSAAYGPFHPQLWFGNDGPGVDSWTGVRFNNINISKGSTVNSAKLQVYNKNDQWISLKMDIFGELASNSASFSNGIVPSKRALTTQKFTHDSNVKWSAGTWINFGEIKNVIQEIVNQPNWQSGNSLSILTHGTGNPWGRKFVSSFDDNPGLAPQLLINFDVPIPTPSLNPISIAVTNAQTFTVPIGYKSMTISLSNTNGLPAWAPTVSFDGGNNFSEQIRFAGSETLVTIPILSNTYRLNTGGSSGFNADITFNPDSSSQAILFNSNANYPFVSNSFNTDSFSSISITVGGGNNPQHLTAISLQRLENGVFVEKQRLACDGGAQCPLQSMPVLGGTYQVSIEGAGTGAVIGALLRPPTSSVSPTPTPTPSPSGSTLLLDDFSGPNLDTNIWEFFSTNGGNYSFDNGSIVVPGGNSMFYIRTKNNPFPSSGPFTVEFGIQFTSPQPSGIGLALGIQQQNGYDPNNYPISFWQDSASGMVVSRFGLKAADLAGGTDTNYHIGKIVYDGDKYLVYNDGVLKYTSPSSATAKTIWFGNPYCCSTTWTGLKLDYIKVTNP